MDKLRKGKSNEMMGFKAGVDTMVHNYEWSLQYWFKYLDSGKMTMFNVFVHFWTSRKEGLCGYEKLGVKFLSLLPLYIIQVLAREAEGKFEDYDCIKKLLKLFILCPEKFC